MTQNKRNQDSFEKAVRDIRRATRPQYSAEEKTRIVLEGLREEDSIAELCHKEGHIRKRHLNWWKTQIGTKTLNRVTPALLVEQRIKLKTEPNDKR